MNHRGMVASLKDTACHNVAQLLLGNNEEGMYNWLNATAEYLLTDEVPVSMGITLEDVHEIVIYAWNHGREEVEIIKAMQARGISINVDGHGGSQIHPVVLLEKILV